VQVALAPAARVLGLHASEFSVAATARESEVLTEVPFSAAVICTVVAEVTAEAVAVKEAVVKPAATVTEAGTETLEWLLDSATVLPPEGAAVFRVTVQVELSAPESEEGLQLNALGLTTG
jgi:hypothetical protein